MSNQDLIVALKQVLSPNQLQVIVIELQKFTKNSVILTNEIEEILRNMKWALFNDQK